MSQKDELVKQLRKIWDMDALEKDHADNFPETINEMNKAINESVYLILADRKRILKPLQLVINIGETDSEDRWGVAQRLKDAIEETLKNAGVEV